MGNPRLLSLAIGLLSFMLSLILGSTALLVLVRCIVPWLKAPGTTHVTWIVAGMQFTGWRLFLPFGVLIIAAVALAYLGWEMLRQRSEKAD